MPHSNFNYSIPQQDVEEEEHEQDVDELEHPAATYL